MSMNAPPDDVSLARMARALGHPARIAILRKLAVQACLCGEIVEVLPLAQSTVSQHLKVLREAGLVSGAVEGPRTCYTLDPEGIAALRSVLGPLLEQWEGATTCSVGSSCR